MFNQTRNAQKQATGIAVLDAAREEFERAGFEGANLRAIATRAGVSAGTVLHHFGDKRELLHAALFHDLDTTLEKLLGELGPGPLEAQLKKLTRGVFRYYQRRPALSRALLKESLFADGVWAKRFSAQVGRSHAVVARLTAEAMERGELGAGINAPLFAAAYFSFFYFALISWVQGAYANPAPLVERLVTQHLEGLRPAQGRKNR
ncbi:MAG: TetR/AcrR family transcriptional regulator [Archangium sp.]|nr:TetR/AcrR family transcriptional regulator [Archangium sp.]